MTLEVNVQIASEEDDLPDPESIRAWATAAVGDVRDGAELTVRIVDEAESAHLNSRYRSNTGPTNVLSFSFDSPPGAEVSILGDIVVCAPVVRHEANEQSKSVNAHWAHMIVHGTLHLLGHTHDGDVDAEAMEAMEARILAGLGFGNPYESSDLS
ncbi:MAG: rRNA maturation RNase YbeY [Gammaproteobacteria bacterium]|nr:rRNA maturation RNase YbeY [Gammaproteobacteria bacterium]NIM74779.1 rRNA maturation RNase YbeY [Gammaproteobacteria bacterium]NIN39210.1 rRNA maturation RNase YbeY [Gammaproteobacteria bacterium]NIO26696.1 rRNA maturation RNase YbeY [Gammaproteobacteria bacterium]NIO67252.1 rRNA maturation RNase YbeY [Gammaproteobacteria bacterium]